MPKRSVTNFRVEDFKPFMDNRLYYKEVDIDHIIEVAKELPDGVSREVLARRLNKIAQTWAFHAAVQKYPTYHQQAEEFAHIEAAAKRLLNTLHVSGDGDISQMPFAINQAGLRLQAASESPGADLLEESVLGVARLHRWARAARERADALARQRGRAPKSEDHALLFLFSELGEIWQGTFSKQLAETAGGPTVRFFQACLKPLPIPPLTDEAVRSRVQNLRCIGK